MVTESGIVTEINEEHPPNAAVSMQRRLAGREISDRDEQYIKASTPMYVTVSGIWICVREEQYEKVMLSMYVTPLGMENEYSEEHPENAARPIDDILSGAWTCVMWRHKANAPSHTRTIPSGSS